MTFQELGTSIVLLSAVLTALGYLSKRLWKFVRLSVHAFETIQRELSPNGGGSTYDIVRKHTEQLAANTARLEAVEQAAAQATTAAGIAVGEAKAGRAVTAEAAENSRGQVAELRGAVSGLAGALTAEGQELRHSIEVMHEQITDEAAHRYADALELLAEHGGPDLRPHIAPHAHVVAEHQPELTSGPVTPDDA